MNISKLIELVFRQESEVGPSDNHSLQRPARRLVGLVTDEELLSKIPIWEASVHRGRRSLIWMASFTGPDGGQKWKSTGVSDYCKALKMAEHWESEARLKRATLGSTIKKPATIVRRKELSSPLGPLTQKEVALILHMSERGVRTVERRAFLKLLNHPGLKEFWQQYLAGELEEATGRLTAEEIQALFDVAQTAEETELIEKLLSIIQPG